MRIFQFFVNPEFSFNSFFDCLFFEPKNLYEKRLGSLCVLGEIEGSKIIGREILHNLAFFVKEKFYQKAGLKEDRALRETLLEANHFLEKKLREEGLVNLGKINLGVLNLKNLKFHFAKAGTIKIQLMRGGKLYEIDKKFKSEEIQLERGRIFGKVASTRLLKDDLIFAETGKMYEFLKKEGFFKKELSFFLDEKKVKDFLKQKEELKKLAGCFLILTLQKEFQNKKSKIEFEKKEFSLKENLLPILEQGKKILQTIKKEGETILSKKQWRLILLFVLTLLIGFVIFRFI